MSGKEKLLFIVSFIWAMHWGVRLTTLIFNTLELMHDADLHARGVMTKIDHPQRGEVNVAGWPLRMSDSHVPIKPSPLLGADNERVYADWLGYSSEEIIDMQKRQII